MPSTRYPLIAQEGWPFILLCVGASIALWVKVDFVWALPVLVLLVFLILLFRDPHRDVPSAPLAVRSPVDGEIKVIEPTDKGLLVREAIRVVIKIDHTGAYTARSPIEGKLFDLRDNVSAGSRLLGHPGMWIHTDEGDDVVFLLRSRPFLPKPKAFLRYGERVGIGQRCAYIRLASHAEVYLPGSAKMLVEVGDKVFTGTSCLATFKHNT
ncbi:MAG: hypothetical protein AAF438_17000 [Pseudomonadota bacterium]